MGTIEPRDLLIERRPVRVFCKIDGAWIHIVSGVGKVPPAVSSGVWMSQRLVLFLLVHQMVQILVDFLDGFHIPDEFWSHLKIASRDLDLLDFPHLILVLYVHVRL